MFECFSGAVLGLCAVELVLNRPVLDDLAAGELFQYPALRRVVGELGFFRLERLVHACHSTGPKTPEGKAIVRGNALRHGILARDVALPGEDAEAFEEVRNKVWGNFSPVGPIEEFLVDQLVNTMWRRQRVARAEAALFYSRIHGLKADRLATEVRSYAETYLVLPSLTRITDEAAHAEASEALRCAEHERDRDEMLLGWAIDADAKEGTLSLSYPAR